MDFGFPYFSESIYFVNALLFIYYTLMRCFVLLFPCCSVSSLIPFRFFHVFVLFYLFIFLFFFLLSIFFFFGKKKIGVFDSVDFDV